MNLSELVDRIKAGDRQAEEEVINLHSQGLTYLLRHLTRNPVLSEDLHQETFCIVLEKVRRGELNNPDAFASFVRGVARNLVRAERRKLNQNEQPLDASPAEHDDGFRIEPSDPTPDQETSLLWRQEADLARRLLAELRSQRDREVLFRFCVADQDKDEICRALGLSSPQFNVVLCRARKRFRELYEQQTPAAGAIGGLLAALLW